MRYPTGTSGRSRAAAPAAATGHSPVVRWHKVRFPAAVGLTLGILLAANVLANRVVPGADVAVGLALVAVLSVVARGARLTADDLGLARRTWGSGVRWGGAAAGVVAAGYGIGAAIPVLLH